MLVNSVLLALLLIPVEKPREASAERGLIGLAPRLYWLGPYCVPGLLAPPRAKRVVGDA